MRRSLILMTILTISLFIPQGQVTGTITNSQDETDLQIQELEGNLTISNYNPEKIERGLNLFALREGRDSPVGARIDNHFALTDMDGKFVLDPISGIGGQPELINDTTFLYMSDRIPHLWNFKDNTTKSFNITRDQHHDIQYDPASNTFMVLEDKVVSITNQSGIQEDMVVDRVTHYETDGTIIREIDLEDHINFSDYYEILERLNDSDIFVFRGQLDPVHSNSIDWDIENNLVYVNSRHFDQVYEFDMDTGELVHTYGFSGDFALFDKNGNEREALWFGAHDFTKLDDDEFLIYNNGFLNFTDVDDDFATDGSSAVHIKVDYETMEIHEIFSHLAPPPYHSSIWGAAQLLDNGNYLISHGSYFKGPDRDNPDHTDFGGAAIEVDAEGNIVWEMQTPFNWGFYRINRIVPTLEATSITYSAEDQELNIDAYSNFPGNIEVYIQDELETTFVWNGESHTYSIGSLDEGNYDFKFVLYDLAGNSVELSESISIESVDTDTPGFLLVSFIPFLAIVVMKRKYL